MAQPKVQSKVTTQQQKVVKAIVLDLGGVLFAEGCSAAAEVLSSQYGYDKKIILSVLRSPESIALRKGLLSDEEFWAAVKSNLPERYDALIIRKAWHDGYLLDEDILELIRQLKPQYTLIVFSGNTRSRVDYLDTKYDFRKHFDQEVYSFDHGLNKPDKAFVEVMLKKAGCRPNEIVYIDDQRSATAPAKALGVKTLIYKRGEIKKLRASLARLGVKLNSE